MPNHFLTHGDEIHPRHESLIRSEILNAEKLDQQAELLAVAHRVSEKFRRGISLAKRLDENQKLLLQVYNNIAQATNKGAEISPASEWLIDNYFVFDEQIRNIHVDLPDTYYRKLPKLDNGPLSNYPRIYELALQFIAHTDSHFNPDLLERFVLSYQKHKQLNISELWAVSIMLRLALVENLRRVAALMMLEKQARAEADLLADAVFAKTGENPTADLSTEVNKLESIQISTAFATQLIHRLRDQNNSNLPILIKLEELLKQNGLSPEEIIRTEHQNQSALTVTVRNIITSMRDISAFNWVEFFEAVSLVDGILKNGSHYGAMDFASKNLYRRAIENFAERSHKTEIEIATLAVAEAKSALSGEKLPPITDILPHQDPGYYLFGKGKPVLEEKSDYHKTFLESLAAAPTLKSFSLYILATIFIVAAILFIFFTTNEGFQYNNLTGLIFLSFLAFFPAWEFSIALVNHFVTRLFPPAILPALALRGGVPSAFKTMIVMPTLLANSAEIEKNISQLEVHYLGNPDGDLRFALLSDWKDQDTEISEHDEKLLEIAIQGINRLNQKHGGARKLQRFHLFHRHRKWNIAENKWMGWERKRGKLMEFNRLLRGAQNTSFYIEKDGPMAAPPAEVKFVVTLDADTKLPRGVIKSLVGKMAHPLNRAQFSSKLGYVSEGYGIMQPRVSSSLPDRSDSSIFQKAFYKASGIDPYAFASSDVYQDLFDEGSYTGKGIYDVDAFMAALENRIPENSVLSHDLLEGTFARAGLVSDLEVAEEFPSRYNLASLRQHRWVRGDWQLLPWIFGRFSRHVPPLGQWKMFDNLRRSLIMPFAYLALITGWALPGENAGPWTIFIFTLFALPLLLPFIDGLLPQKGTAFNKKHLMSVLQDFGRVVLQITLLITFLPHQAWLMLDAIVRVGWRKLISHKHLLEWTATAETKSTGQNSLLTYYHFMSGGPLLAALAIFICLFTGGQSYLYAFPIILLWILSPAIAYLCSLPARQRKLDQIEKNDVLSFRKIGRQTWRFFETFVTVGESWLPPDNFQEDPTSVIAHRTSPTNIGLYLLSVISAKDFGWITNSETAERLAQTISTVQKLEHYRGHIYNWYETRSMAPLHPRYISSVDSGNFAGYLIVVAQAATEASSAPCLNIQFAKGIEDSIALAEETLKKLNGIADAGTCRQLQEKLASIKHFLSLWANGTASIARMTLTIEKSIGHADVATDLARTIEAELGSSSMPWASEAVYWCSAILTGLNKQRAEILSFFPWIATALRYAELLKLDENTSNPSIKNSKFSQTHFIPEIVVQTLCGPMPALSALPKLFAAFDAALKTQTDTIVIFDATELAAKADMIADLQKGLEATNNLLNAFNQISYDALQQFKIMDFTFLLDPHRKLLSIGYRVEDNSLDPSYYDLLASEARLTSLVGIAKGDLPTQNWFRLGRTSVSVGLNSALVSWSGSMFEYLMPVLVINEPEDSLLAQTNRIVVKRQIQYGHERNVPWGISESAYNARDFELTYQYSGFGVPGLGLKRGLSENLVIAPYATALAAMINPKAALKNLLRIARMGGRGPYGWYEAIDYTPKRIAEGHRYAIVRCYMAHHQGMSLVAIHNVLFHGLMRNRFHAEPAVQTTELLLQELPPRNTENAKPRIEELENLTHARESSTTHPRFFQSPHSATPRTHLLAHGEYGLMMTTAGSGYSVWRDIAISRWREDSTQDHYGSYIFLRDVHTERVWSATYQPLCAEMDSCHISLAEDKADFSRRTKAVTTTLSVAVSSEDAGEVRRISINNISDATQEIEVTSYMELALSKPAADATHPAFNKMFIETEYLSRNGALLATRRPRSPADNAVWVVHMVSIEGEAIGNLQYETDRAKFIGRGRSLKNPIAMEGRPLGQSEGTVLDPIFSLRCRVRIPPGAVTHVVFWTLVTESREAAIALAEKYRDNTSFERVVAHAWTQAQLQSQHLAITPQDAHNFQRLANNIIYADKSLRPSSENIIRGAAPQSTLWSSGISGDLPIVLMRIDKSGDLNTVRYILKAHEYWESKKLAVDLVILNEQATSYLEQLHQEIDILVRTTLASPRAFSQGNKGGIYLLRADQISTESKAILHSAARITILGHRGSVAEQVRLLSPEDAAQPPSLPHLAVPRPTTLPALELEFSNGIGGFSAETNEYIITLENGVNTPAPWINVIANPTFGFQTSAEGTGYSWAINSRDHQITPWSNDPVCDPAGEAIYIKDEETNAIWSPTCMPIRLPHTTYRTSHGFGYTRFECAAFGLALSLTQFVPVDDSVKISRLQINNVTSRSRKISITSYAEWVLGNNRGQMAPYIITEVDESTGAIFAKNPWNDAFGSRTAFAHIIGELSGWTGDRKEFIGRNGSLAAPAGLAKGHKLSKKTGAGLDPAAALQSTRELKPGETIEVIILLGSSANAAEARALLWRMKAADYDALFNQVKSYWQTLLNQVQVKTPDAATNFMLNGWLLYQTIVCRIMARAAFYQASGAYGFRDQIQDTLAVSVVAPEISRAHLIRAAGRQFVEGDVQHWWLPTGRNAGMGIRTRFADDALWLPYAVAAYVKTTHDIELLMHKVPYITGRQLKENEHEAFFLPELSEKNETIFDHCVLAIEYSLTTGENGLPLFFGGDWNDGMNRVGILGKGESVWLGWFTIFVIQEFLPYAEKYAPEKVGKWKEYSNSLLKNLEANAWDGEWYKRGFYDDGSPLGSSVNSECKIDQLVQSWAVISKAAMPERQELAMQSVERNLIWTEEGLSLLFAPPFDKTSHDPGYIKGYPPGLRENGGQYTHASIWSVIAFSLLGENDKAYTLFSMLNPINHANNRTNSFKYKVEPYVVAADIYANPQHMGRGGWTWYTGSAGWLYRAGLEYILGFKKEGETLYLRPALPNHWPSCEITYTYKNTLYHIKYLRQPRQDNSPTEQGATQAIFSAFLDGNEWNSENGFPLVDDKIPHQINIILPDRRKNGGH